MNDHWSPDATYTFLNLADETAAISWPIPLDEVEISAKDQNHPRLADVVPMPPKKILVTGANGQLGRALRAEFGDHPWIEYATRADLDLTSPDLDAARRWRDYGTIINAAAYTRSTRPRRRTDASRPGRPMSPRRRRALARIATANGITLVHVSSDYVFDGTKDSAYGTGRCRHPLGVYGQTKARAMPSWPPCRAITSCARAGSSATERTSSDDGVARRAGDRPARGERSGPTPDVHHRHRLHDPGLLDAAAPFGVYNVTGVGTDRTWYDIARDVFAITGHDPERVSGVGTDEYFAASPTPVAPRPATVCCSSTMRAPSTSPATRGERIARLPSGVTLQR